MGASVAWEIVELGHDTWEVVLGEANGTVRGTPEATDAGDAPQQEGEPISAALFERLGEIDDRLTTIERRVVELGRSEGRLDDLERAHGDLERAHAEAERRSRERDDALRGELEEIYRQAEARLAETHAKPGWRQRRLEIKLARMERDRKIRRAERRLEEQSRHRGTRSSVRSWRRS